EREQRIAGGDGFGGGADLRSLRQNAGAQLLEQLLLQGAPLLFRVEDLLLVLAKLSGDVALGADRRLLADVLRRHEVQVGAGDLQGVAEDAGVADLERADSRALPLAGLQPE